MSCIEWSCTAPHATHLCQHREVKQHQRCWTPGHLHPLQLTCPPSVCSRTSLRSAPGTSKRLATSCLTGFRALVQAQACQNSSDLWEMTAATSSRSALDGPMLPRQRRIRRGAVHMGLHHCAEQCTAATPVSVPGAEHRLHHKAWTGSPVASSYGIPKRVALVVIRSKLGKPGSIAMVSRLLDGWVAGTMLATLPCAAALPQNRRGDQEQGSSSLDIRLAPQAALQWSHTFVLSWLLRNLRVAPKRTRPYSCSTRQIAVRAWLRGCSTCVMGSAAVAMSSVAGPCRARSEHWFSMMKPRSAFYRQPIVSLQHQSA